MKKGAPLIWDEQAQFSFDALKHALMTTPLIHPLDYMQYYILYLATSTSTICMLLVQEDYSSYEHVVYYLNKCLLNVETHYSHVEKLVLEEIIAFSKILSPFVTLENYYHR